MVFSFEPIAINGAYIINSYSTEDNRGSFVKNFEKDIFAKHGVTFDCSESFISVSDKNVIRGMHFQLHHPQSKLVGVISGKVYDVIVDLRKESISFGKWVGVYLSSENKTSLFIPRGCAHGFIALTNNSIVSYMCDGKYDKETDTGILYCDNDINIKWPINDLSQAILGERDKTQMTFAEFCKSYDFIY